MNDENPNWHEATRRKPARPDGQTDRLPPHSIEAEQGVLGCALLEPGTVMHQLDELGLLAEWFFDLRHKEIFSAMRALHTAIPRQPVDIITLQQRLKDAGLLEQLGGIAFLNALQDAVPSAANLSYYVEYIKEKWQLRTLLAAFTEGAARIYEHDGSVDELLAETQKTFVAIERSASPALEKTIKAIIAEKVIPALEGHYTRGRAQIDGVTTGLEYVDKIFCGMGGKHGNYYVIAARPNTGKTSLVTQIAMHAAQDYQRWVPAADPDTGQPRLRYDEEKGMDVPVLIPVKGISVGISSLEMTSEALVQKMLFQRGRVDLQRWRTGYAGAEDLGLLVRAGGELCSANRIIIDDTPRLRIGQLKAKWRRWYHQYGVRLFILDYLQLMQGDAKKFRPQRNEELAEVSAEIQALGKELNCPMLILAQMNRDYEKDPNRAPRMSDLKDCGAVEQDADVINFLYEPRLSDKHQEFFEEKMTLFFDQHIRPTLSAARQKHATWKKWDGRPQRINVLVAKNRFGPKGKAELLLLHSSTTFVDWNVWLKENKFAAPAKGEESRYDGDESDEEDTE